MKDNIKFKWVKIHNGIEITNGQVHNGKSFNEIKGLLKEGEEIASYPLLQELRNISYESNWKKYPFIKEFWVWVYPNPDKAAENNGYVARLDAGPDSACLLGDWSPLGEDPSLGGFLVRKCKS